MSDSPGMVTYEELVKLREVNKDLLAVLREVLALANYEIGNKNPALGYRARAAIAKAKAGAE